MVAKGPHLDEPSEAKKTERPLFLQWARKLERKAGKSWILIWSGDRRQRFGTGPYVVMPLEMFEWMQGPDVDSDLEEYDRKLEDVRQSLTDLEGWYRP